MSASKSEIETLNKWLESRLGGLVAHGEKVRDLLQSPTGAAGIIESAADLVTAENPVKQELSPQQMETWKRLLPLLSEHGLMAVRGSGPPVEPDRPLTKAEAAEYLGVSVSKLERCMAKRQIEYEKYGAGQTAMVRFRQAELDKYREKRKVTPRKTGPERLMDAGR